MSSGYAFLDNNSQIQAANLREIGITRLATIGGINLKTVAVTTLYTVPAGKTAVIVRCFLRTTAVDTHTVPASITMGGNSTAFDDFNNALPTALFTAANQFIYADFNNGQFQTAYPAATNFSLNVTIGATATTLTASVDVFGYLF